MCPPINRPQAWAIEHQSCTTGRARDTSSVALFSDPGFELATPTSTTGGGREHGPEVLGPGLNRVPSGGPGSTKKNRGGYCRTARCWTIRRHLASQELQAPNAAGTLGVVRRSQDEKGRPK